MVEGCDVNVTTVLFDDRVDIIHDRFPINQVKPLTDEDYYVRGCTALLDAVSTAIAKIDNIQSHLPEENRASKVMFVITTDGMENSSIEYTYPANKKLIGARKEKGWEFLFLGVNIDATAEAEKIGISRNRSVTYENDSEGVSRNFKAVGKAMDCYTSFKSMAAEDMSSAISDDWSADVSDYHEKKKALRSTRSRARKNA